MSRSEATFAKGDDERRDASAAGFRPRRRGVAARARQAWRVALVPLICGVLLAGCNASRNAYVAPPPAKVVVAQPLQKPVTLYFELTGNTQAFNSVDLVARVQGYLEFD